MNAKPIPLASSRNVPLTPINPLTIMENNPKFII
ncbi:unnamed protein product [Spirodela intermedia]|uniref:Uncharacterized protein n=2 Tax=Spirodela intermedia TaxID=51605 RepID=A0A7I8JH07_SPIIN|nr:unnamed protein product [Spirodela intermedia]CAA6668833.1 unnamed protein product [Spirodela intermedia]CAA7405739.1 unnamed protein product [Spirodela intermedia]